MALTTSATLKTYFNTGDQPTEAQFADFIEGEFLKEQNEANSELSQIITQLQMIGDNMYGVWDFVKRIPV